MVVNGLKKGIKEFINGGKLCEQNNLLIVATENYFKAILHAVDFYIYGVINKTPDNHNERFVILENLDKKMYDLISKLFKLYRKSYRESISKDEFERVKNGLKETLKITKLEKEFEKYL